MKMLIITLLVLVGCAAPVHDEFTVGPCDPSWADIKLNGGAPVPAGSCEKGCLYPNDIVAPGQPQPMLRLCDVTERWKKMGSPTPTPPMVVSLNAAKNYEGLWGMCFPLPNDAYIYTDTLDTTAAIVFAECNLQPPPAP